MKFEYRESGDGYLARLEYSEQRIETSRADSTKGSQKSSQKILEAVAENPHITIAQLSDRCGIGPRAVQKNINVLRDQGLLRRVGPARGGHWDVLQG